MATASLLGNPSSLKVGRATAAGDSAPDRTFRPIGGEELLPAVSTRGMPLPPTSREPKRLSANLLAGMLTDYYNNIFALPPKLEVQNPQIGAEQPFAIWNAYLSGNEITSRADLDAVGLINTGVSGEVFRAVQVKPYSITVTNTAPIQIDAFYTYTATLGTTIFNFVASLAVVVDIPPEEPFEQDLEYLTDVFRARDGSERRISVRQDKARHSFKYNLLFNTDRERQAARRELFNNPRLPLVLPLWHEHLRLSQPVAIGGKIFSGDYSLSDIQVGDNIYVENPTGTEGEIQVVSAISDTEIEIRNVANIAFPAGSHIYPTATIRPNDNQSLRYFPVNAFYQSVVGLRMDDKPLGGKGATLDEYDGFPVLEAVPSANGLVSENFNIHSADTDFGGARQVFLPESNSTLIRQLSFFIPSRDRLQYWKLFLDTVRGRQKPFLHATYQPDIEVISFTAGTAEVEIENEPSISAWLAADAFTRLRIVMEPSGTPIYRKVDNFTDNGDGTALLILDEVIPDEGPSTGISTVSFLQKTRLSGDKIKFQHFDSYSRVNFSTETIEQ